jgi:hypothetical protein
MQLALPLTGGWHAGPLFVAVKRRPPVPKMRSTHRDRVVRRRTPAWANRKAIALMYRVARRCTADTGVRWSVDHIVPLHHPLVCGLHVWTNLRVVPLVENMQRSNVTDWPDGPFEQQALL